MSQVNYERGARARRSTSYNTRASTAAAREDNNTFSEFDQLHSIDDTIDNNDNMTTTTTISNNTQTDTDTQYELLNRTASMLYNYSPLDRDWSQLTSEGYGMEASQPTTSSSSLADTNATSTNGFTFHDPPATYLNEASASALPPSTRRQREEQERHRFNYNNRTNDTGNTAYRSSRTLLSAMGRMQREQIQESNEDDADNNTEDDINTEADTTQSSMHNTSQYSGDGHGTAMEGMRLGSLLMEPTLHLRDQHSFTRENTMAEYTEGDSSVLADNSTLTDQEGMENGGEDDDDDDEQTTLRRRHPLGRSTTRQSTTLHDEQSSSDNNSNNSNNEQQCRICFAGPEESNVLGQLISPCLCKGTMRYVHLECLNAWRNAGHSRSAFFECNQCGYRYSFARTRIATIIQHPVVLFLITIMVFVLVTLLAGFITKLIFRISLGGDYNYFNENVSSDLLVTDNEGNIWRRISIGDFDDDDTGQLVLLRTREEELDRLARLTANQDNSGDDDDDNDADGLLGIMEDPARLEQALSFTNIDLFHMIMGLVTVSVIGFLQFVIGIAYIGPLPLFGNMHTRVNNLRGGGGRQGGGSGFDLLLVIVILIGILRAFKTIYQSISTIVQRNLERLGQRILDVPKTD